MSDAEAVIVYATENATQDGNRASAMAGAVASATWLLARAVMRGDIRQICQISPKAAECASGNIASDKGMGREIVFDFLYDVPGGQFTEPVVKDFLANIKGCGEYAKIIADIRKEIDDELAEELKKAEAAKRATKNFSTPIL